MYICRGWGWWGQWVDQNTRCGLHNWRRINSWEITDKWELTDHRNGANYQEKDDDDDCEDAEPIIQGSHAFDD